jgi:hypothetical protein
MNIVGRVSQLFTFMHKRPPYALIFSTSLPQGSSVHLERWNILQTSWSIAHFNLRC